LAVWLVVDFEALSYQVTTTFDTSCAARIRTAPAINYTACWQLVFFHIRLFVIYLAFIFLSLSNCTNLSTKHKFILFFERGQSQNRPERPLLGLERRKLFCKPLVGALARAGLQRCLRQCIG